MQTGRCRGVVMVTVVIGVLGFAACDQQPTGNRAPKGADRSEPSASSPAHPDVPGRTEPCLGRLEKSGYPCEPTPPGKTTSESSREQKEGQQKAKPK